MSQAQVVVSRLWKYCDPLRDDGLSYLDYIEQLTYLLFLKMAHEQTQPPYNRPSTIPKGYDWASLLARDGDDLEAHSGACLKPWEKRVGCWAPSFGRHRTRFRTRPCCGD